MPPLTVLNVAEKPSVARALAGVFAQMHGSRDRPMQRGEAAQIFVCDNVTFPNVLRQGGGRPVNGPDVPHTMITTSVRGHLASQDFGPQYGWNSCPPIALFEAPIQTTYRTDMQPLERMLQQQARNAGTLILWLDCDREGEAISDEVRAVCLAGNPRLNNKVFRAKFSTVLSPEIRRALRSLGRVNESWVEAVHARSEHDLRVGAAFTRFQTLRLQKKFDGFDHGKVVSYGPCQFPTLGFVVERWARIETFIPEDFWFLDMTIRLNADGTVVGVTEEGGVASTSEQQRQPQQHAGGRPIHLSWKRGRLYDRVMTMVLYESCLDAGEAIVTSLTGRPKNKWRPVPLATVELQKRASRYLRIGSESVMTAAEELYQQGFISYPRTETERFRPEFDHMSLIQSFQAVAGDFGEYSTKLLSNNNFQNPRHGQNDDNAHPPITPAKAVDPETIADRTQRGIYVLVVKHYLACCSRDAIGKETQLTVKMASEEFSAKGLMILERNWLEIYAPWERWSTGQGELPRVQVGSRIKPTSLLMKEGRTSPPQPISEVELISLMDRNGIGTDATIAQHITTIQERQYAEKDPNLRFLPTKLGIALVEGYNSMGYQLNKPDLRREMEAECNQVAAGQKSKEDIMAPILSRMRECFQRANTEAHKLDEAVARHYSRLGSDDRNARVLRRDFSLCGACGNRTELKQLSGSGQQRGNNQANQIRKKIVYCSTCTVGLPLPRGEQSPMNDPTNRDQPFLCPICQYQVIKISRGEGYTGNGYQVCPMCFSDAPAEHGGAASSGDFKCFECSHPSCSLASGTRGGDVEVYACPFCESSGSTGKVTLRKTSRGYVLSCGNSNGRERCQYSVWLPKAASSASVDSDDDAEQGSFCNRCSTPGKQVRTLKLKWKSGSVPPHFGREYVGCILCDQALRRDMNITLPQLNQVRRRGRPTGREGRERRGDADRSRSQGAGADISCFKCGRPGHYASACPNSRQ
mmetsp:Transcript_13185/g.38827  ORF Transcript_13185/g.38827 Transcript_13185/m.38827 type:complete len:979 (-) Transcript_13185:215-3151(-)